MADHHEAGAGQGKSSWTPNHYILAALGGTLAVAAVVTVTSLILSPALVTFSVAHASRKIFPDGTANLTVTIAAHNPSRRCQASYRSVFVDLKNSSTGAGRTWIQANVPDKTFPIGYARGPNVTFIMASVLLVDDNDKGYASRLNASGGGLTVVVTARVRFKIGVTPTRQYGIKVFCPHVVFSDEQKSSSATAQQGNFSCSG